MKLDITQCVRCGEDHADVAVMMFTNPPSEHLTGGRLCTHFAICPTLGEPMLIADLKPENLKAECPKT